MSEDTPVHKRALDEPARNIRRRRLIKFGVCPCARCKKVVPLSAMSVGRHGTVGSYCDPCRREMQRESYHRRKARKQEQQAQASQQKPVEELGPRKRRQALLALGLL